MIALLFIKEKYYVVLLLLIKIFGKTAVNTHIGLKIPNAFTKLSVVFEAKGNCSFMRQIFCIYPDAPHTYKRQTACFDIPYILILHFKRKRTASTLESERIEVHIFFKGFNILVLVFTQAYKREYNNQSK